MLSRSSGELMKRADSPGLIAVPVQQARRAALISRAMEYEFITLNARQLQLRARRLGGICGRLRGGLGFVSARPQSQRPLPPGGGTFPPSRGSTRRLSY